MNVALRWMNQARGWVLPWKIVNQLRKILGMWVSIVGNSIGPFKVKDCAKINAENYCKFLDRPFF